MFFLSFLDIYPATRFFKQSFNVYPFLCVFKKTTALDSFINFYWNKVCLLILYTRNDHKKPSGPFVWAALPRIHIPVRLNRPQQLWCMMQCAYSMYLPRSWFKYCALGALQMNISPGARAMFECVCVCLVYIIHTWIHSKGSRNRFHFAAQCQQDLHSNSILL